MYRHIVNYYLDFRKSNLKCNYYGHIVNYYLDFRKSNLKCNYSGHIVNILTLDLLKVVFDQI